MVQEKNKKKFNLKIKNCKLTCNLVVVVDLLTCKFKEKKYL